MAEEVVGKLQHIPDSARITIHGGEPRVVHVYLDTERLAAYGLSPWRSRARCELSNAQLESGAFEQGNAGDSRRGRAVPARRRRGRAT